MNKQFISAAETFFTLNEEGKGIKNKLNRLYSCLADLNCHALKLSNATPTSEVDYQPTRLKDEEIRPSICQSFTELGFYWGCLNPNEMEKDPSFGTGDAIDDLVDIYKELKAGYDLYKAGHEELATSHWCESYKLHWGEHLVALQVILYDMIYNPKENQP